MTSTREATLYGADVSRDKLPLAIDVLDQIGTKQIFKVKTREGGWWDGAIQAVGSEMGSCSALRRCFAALRLWDGVI